MARSGKDTAVELSLKASRCMSTSMGCVERAVHGTLMVNSRANALLTVMGRLCRRLDRSSSKLCKDALPPDNDTLTSFPASLPASPARFMNFRSHLFTKLVRSRSIVTEHALRPQALAPEEGFPVTQARWFPLSTTAGQAGFVRMSVCPMQQRSPGHQGSARTQLSRSSVHPAEVVMLHRFT